MQTTITLTSEERLAIQLLQANPEAFSQIAKNGTVDLGDVYRWYAKLLRHLEMGHKKRRQDYTTVEIPTEKIEEIVETSQTSE